MVGKQELPVQAIQQYMYLIMTMEPFLASKSWHLIDLEGNFSPFCPGLETQNSRR